MPEESNYGSTSAPEAWQPHRANNPWKPASCWPETRYEQSEVYRRMLGILNRVTQQSLDILLEQARELPLADPQHLPEILELFLSKAQDEPMFAPVYAKMCQDLASRAGVQQAIATACDAHFQHHHHLLLQYREAFLGPVTSQMVDEEILARKRTVGHMGFVSELLRLGIVGANQVSAMLETLLRHSDDRSLECLCRLLGYAGQLLSPTHQAVLDRCCSYLESRIGAGTLSARLRFLTLDTLDLYANGWRPLRQSLHSASRNVRG
ncbi:uncharacterized protein LOC143029077 isoform X2 [Oratosquilla oratoria]